MSFRTLMFGLSAGAIGLIAYSEYSGVSPEQRDAAAAIANSPADGAAATAGNWLTAFGIVLGNGGEMRSASGPSDARLVTDPLTTRRAEFYGWEVDHPGLIGPNDEMFLVQSAVAGLPMSQPLETPADVVARAPEPGCAVPAPAPGEALAKVQVASGGQPTGYHAVSDADLVSGAMEFIARAQRAKVPAEEQPSGRTRPVDVVNVVLTDEAAPQYLVLQAGAEPVLFNLHPTPGVTLARIVVVGRPGTAVSPPSPETPVHFLAMSPDCAPQPWRAAQPWWDLYHRPGASSGDYEEKSVARHAAYDAWFTATFGAPSDPGTVGGWEAAHVLLGPLPAAAEARAPYRPLTGARIVALGGPLLYAAPDRAREADVAARRLALATEAAGGDLSILNPAPMERAQ